MMASSSSENPQDNPPLNSESGDNTGHNQEQARPETSDGDKAQQPHCSRDDNSPSDANPDSAKSHDDILQLAICEESMPSSDFNKENNSGNARPEVCPTFDSTDFTLVGESLCPSDYDKADQIPLPELLKIHHKQLVSGFEFGEATQRRAQENMKSARDKNIAENNRKSWEQEGHDHVEGSSTEIIDDEDSSVVSSEQDHKTPHSQRRQRSSETSVNPNSEVEFCKTSRGVPECLRDYPDCVEVWLFMVYKEEAALTLRNSRLFTDFKSVTPRMRAILLDWLMEVSEVYHLRRVTYYLSVDYFDRFLSIRPDIPKNFLQLIGITCLYIAAKVEEIYPPNLSEFAYVCDGACQSKDMVSCELLILNSLGWEVILTTPSDWLNLYMQLHHKSIDMVRSRLNMDMNKDFVFPQYSAFQFTRASQLMDLLSLDPGFLRFTYSTIAATAMYFTYDREVAISVSGLTWEQMRECVEHMQVYHDILQRAPDPRLQSCLGGPHPEEYKLHASEPGRTRLGNNKENYSFQTHIASIEYFEQATLNRLSQVGGNCLDKYRTAQPEDQPGEVQFVAVHSEAVVTRHEEVSERILNELATMEPSQLFESIAKARQVDQSDPPASTMMSMDEIFAFILRQQQEDPDPEDSS